MSDTTKVSDEGRGEPETGHVLSEAAIQAIKVALRSSLREVSAARHDYPPVHNFQKALDEINALTAPPPALASADANAQTS